MKGPKFDFVTNGPILLTNGIKIKTNSPYSSVDRQYLNRLDRQACCATRPSFNLNYRQESKKNVIAAYNQTKNNVNLHFK